MHSHTDTAQESFQHDVWYEHWVWTSFPSFQGQWKTLGRYWHGHEPFRVNKDESLSEQSEDETESSGGKYHLSVYMKKQLFAQVMLESTAVQTEEAKWKLQQKCVRAMLGHFPVPTWELFTSAYQFSNASLVSLRKDCWTRARCDQILSKWAVNSLLRFCHLPQDASLWFVTLWGLSQCVSFDWHEGL